MNAPAGRLFTAIAALALALPMGVSAQEDGGWTFRGTGEFGPFFATRDLAKNVQGIQELQTLQASVRLDQAWAWAGGVELVSPDQRTVFRGIVRGTVGGTASAELALCNILEGELCIPRTADSRVVSFVGEVVFVQGDPSDTFRQNFILGLGLRSYQFTVESCVGAPGTNPDLEVICNLVTEIYQDQAQVQPFLEFGFGFSTDRGPATLFARVVDVIGPYQGGAGNTDGDYQNDIFLTAGVSLRVR